jgi:hypothetical protein
VTVKDKCEVPSFHCYKGVKLTIYTTAKMEDLRKAVTLQCFVGSLHMTQGGDTQRAELELHTSRTCPPIRHARAGADDSTFSDLDSFPNWNDEFGTKVPPASQARMILPSFPAAAKTSSPERHPSDRLHWFTLIT